MFAGGRRRSSNNIRTMQLFHELKQQFPTVPDNIVSAYINHTVGNKSSANRKDLRQHHHPLQHHHHQQQQHHKLEDVLDIGSRFSQRQLEEELMGRTSTRDSIEAVLSLSKSSTPTSNDTDNSNDFEDRSYNRTKRDIDHRQQAATADRRTKTDEMDERDASDSIVKRDVNETSENCLTKKDDDEKEEKVVLNSGNNNINSYNSGSGNVNDNVVVGDGGGGGGGSGDGGEGKKGSFLAKRPDSLSITNVVGDFGRSTGGRIGRQIQPSGRCSDIHKLLNSETVNNKPPRSPLSCTSSSKKFGNSKSSNRNEQNNNNTCKSPILSPEAVATIAKRQSTAFNNNNNINSNIDHSPSNYSKKTDQKRETADTPTQTTDTLLGPPAANNGLNLSLNVNCSMDLVQSPTQQKCSTALHIVPQQPWCQQDPASSSSQRSYTSVNLTLRPPSTEPQAPIDITSQNSSLTYSTSSFDSQKGLASKLQITVGPSGTGSVSSLRVRPRSSYHPDSDGGQDVNPVRAGSLPDLAGNQNPTVIIKQQARIDKLKIELRTEKTRLIAMQQEIADLESMENNVATQKEEKRLEQQLQKEIKHLRGQCERLTLEVDRQSESRVPLGETNAEFYRHIYTGQRLPTALSYQTERRLQNAIENQYRMSRSQQQQQQYLDTVEGPKWNCHMCTFQNHPLLDKCEQCEMPRILHGRHSTSPDPSIAFSMIRPIGENVPYSRNQMWKILNDGDGLVTTDARLLRLIDKSFKRTEPRSNLSHSQSANSICPTTTNAYSRNLSVPNPLMTPTNVPASNNNNRPRRQNIMNRNPEEFPQDGPSANGTSHFVNNTKTCNANC